MSGNEREGLKRLVDDFGVAAMHHGAHPDEYNEHRDEMDRLKRKILSLLTQAQEPVGVCVGSFSSGPETGDMLLVSPSPGVTVPQPIGTKLYTSPTLDGSLEGVIGFDIHEAIWGPLVEDEAVRPEAWEAAAAVMDILRTRTNVPALYWHTDPTWPCPTCGAQTSAREGERETLRISKDMVAFLRASQNRTTSDDPVYVRTHRGADL